MATASCVEEKSAPAFEALFTNASMGMLLTGPEGNISAANPFVAEEFGYDSHELEGCHISVLFPRRYQLSHPHFYKHFLSGAPAGTTATVNRILAVKKDGKEFPVEINLAHLILDHQPVVAVYIKNITLEQELEQEVEMQAGQLELLMEHIPTAVAMLNSKLEFMSVSRRWKRDFDLEEEKLVGRSFQDILPGLFPAWSPRFHLCLQGESLRGEEELTIVKKGRREWIRWEFCSWYTAEKSAGGVILFSECITEQRRLQNELKQLNDDLEQKIREKTQELTERLQQEKELSELKSKFVSIASHEFRTPLSTILSSAYLVERYTGRDDQPKREVHLKRIVSSVETLTEILTDLLSVGKIEEGKVMVRNREFNVRQFCIERMGELKSILKTKQKLHYHHSGNESICLDEILFKNILINLVANAAKFSPEGAPIMVTTLELGEWLTLSVRDKGIGISMEDQEHLAEPFYRGSNAANIKGTGLGLHIVAKYTELMKGKMAFTSQLNKGTEFILTFPSKKTDYEKDIIDRGQ